MRHYEAFEEMLPKQVMQPRRSTEPEEEPLIDTSPSHSEGMVTYAYRYNEIDFNKIDERVIEEAEQT